MKIYLFEPLREQENINFEGQIRHFFPSARNTNTNTNTNT